MEGRSRRSFTVPASESRANNFEVSARTKSLSAHLRAFLERWVGHYRGRPRRGVRYGASAERLSATLTRSAIGIPLSIDNVVPSGIRALKTVADVVSSPCRPCSSDHVARSANVTGSPSGTGSSSPSSGLSVCQMWISGRPGAGRWLQNEREG